MAKKLFVGNISWGATADELQQLFSQYGNVEDVFIVKDKMTGRSKGFGFVTFTDDKEADRAVDGLNDYELGGRKIVVNEAKPMEQKPRNNFKNNYNRR